MRWVALALLILVCLPAAFALPPTWDQPGGDGTHAGVVALPDGDLDILARITLASGGQVIGQPAQWIGRAMGAGIGVVATPHGIVALRLDVGSVATWPTSISPGQSYTGCQLIILRPVTFALEALGPRFDCPHGANLIAYDAAHDELLLGVDGPQADVLRGVNATHGTLSWTHGPGPGSGAAVAPGNSWEVVGALDEALDTVYLGYYDNATQGNVLEALHLGDLIPLWSTSVSASDGVFSVLRQPLPASPSATDKIPVQAVRPLQVVLTTNGLAIHAAAAQPSTPCYGVSASQVQACESRGWLEMARDGTLRFAESDLLDETVTQTPGTANPPKFDSWGAAQGDLFAYRRGSQLFVANPVIGPGYVVDLGEYSLTGGAPFWTNRNLFVGQDRSVTVFAATPTTPVSHWFQPEGGRFSSLVAEDAGDAIAYSIVGQAQGIAAVFDRFSPLTGQTLQELRMPGLLPLVTDQSSDPIVTWHDIGFTEWTDQTGVLAWCRVGQAAVLGVRPDAQHPLLETANLYPSVGSVVELRPTWPTGTPDSLTVTWGDAIEQLPAGQPLHHVYPTAGDVMLRVTGNFADGTTSTGSMLLHVGGHQPTFFESAFNTENQNLTYFLIGLAVTLLGALFALVERRRSQSRIAADLATLDQLALEGEDDPTEALRDLADYERGLRERLERGKMRDANFTLLDQRVRELRQRLGGSARTAPARA